MNTQDILVAFDIYHSIQCEFDYDYCKDVWPVDVDYYWNKWMESEGNLINFMSRLDSNNKMRLIGYYMMKITY